MKFDPHNIYAFAVISGWFEQLHPTKKAIGALLVAGILGYTAATVVSPLLGMREDVHQNSQAIEDLRARDREHSQRISELRNSISSDLRSLAEGQERILCRMTDRSPAECELEIQQDGNTERSQ